MATAENVDLISTATTLLNTTFGESTSIIYAVAAPGRVNLIGEHTDYNEGFVLPMALQLKTYLVGRRSDSQKCHFFSSNMNENVVEFHANHSLTPGIPRWGNYIKGVIFEYLKDVPNEKIAIDAVIISEIPMGAGLSSSAALEVATATLIEEIYNLQISKEEKALRCVRCEQNYCNLPCGIMDQYISSCAVEGHALLIDCRSQNAVPIPLNDHSISIVIANSNVSHSLAESEYSLRVQQCNEVVLSLQKKYSTLCSLRDATVSMLETIRDDICEVNYRRALHVVIEEDQRTLCAVEALKNSDYTKLGECMIQSHQSLKEKYEVSTRELDILVEIALQVEGVYGSRMTGGGFGGCTVTIVKKCNTERLVNTIEKEYREQTGKKATCIVTSSTSDSELACKPLH